MQNNPTHSPFSQQDHDVVLDSDRRITSLTSETTITTPTKNKQPNDPIISSENILIPNSNSYNLSQASHPLVCLATIFFKILSLFSYLFVSIFVPNVITYILVLVSSALDFWVVKNVSGRLLVGLRWWSQYDDKGSQIWRFQSFDKQFKSDPIDGAFFWTGQIAATVIWGLFLVVKILSLSLFWGTLNAINFSLGALNLYGYYRCRSDYKNKLKALKISSLRTIAGKIFF